MDSKIMASGPEAIKIHIALQLWHRISKGIIYLIIMVARVGMLVVMLVVMVVVMLVAMLIAIGLRRAGDRQTAWLAVQSEDNRRSSDSRGAAARTRRDSTQMTARARLSLPLRLVSRNAPHLAGC